MDCGLLGSSVHGIFKASILEWVAISSSSWSSWPRDGTCICCVSCIGRWILYHWATYKRDHFYRYRIFKIFFFSFSTLFIVSPSYLWVEPIHRFLYLWWVLESIPHGYWGTNVYHTSAFCLARFLLRKLLIILLIIPCMYWLTSFLLLSIQLSILQFHYSVSASLWFILQKVHLATCISNLYLSSNFWNSLSLFLLFKCISWSTINIY